ncbi:MAG: hypothetical protein DRO95_06125 [Candidatus Altiarchaeales archaeon]|nr:MAG: hypothetical protein DRO95_06125 [Candidatus Altiarchaeales archaeon]
MLTEIEKRAQKFKPITLEEAKFLLNLEWDKFSKIMKLAREQADGIFGKRLYFHYTGNNYPALSLTGEKCALMCKHCKAELLKRLIPIRNNEELIKVCINLEKNGAIGCLLTGGCDTNAKVPIVEFVDGIREVKRRTNLGLIAHTGIINKNEASLLKNAGLDGILLDIVGSKETTREIYGIEIPEEKYRDSLIACQDSGIEIISPHICVGLHNGKLKHELNALEIIRAIEPTTIVIIALMPLIKTEIRSIRVRAEDVARIISIARLMFPQIGITLGCAKSSGEERARIDELGIKAGVSAIALPTERAIETAKKLGYEIKEVKTCCGVPG